MEHGVAKIHPALRRYLDELSKNESTFWAQPVTSSSFSLLCILYMAYQVPGPAEYGDFSREAFKSWLNEQLAPGSPPGTAVPRDCIPERYFDMVGVSKEVGQFTTQCFVQYDGASWVKVPSMRRADLRFADAYDADLTGYDLQDDDLQGATLSVTPELAVNITFSNPLQF